MLIWKQLHYRIVFLIPWIDSIAGELLFLDVLSPVSPVY